MFKLSSNQRSVFSVYGLFDSSRNQIDLEELNVNHLYINVRQISVVRALGCVIAVRLCLSWLYGNLCFLNFVVEIVYLNGIFMG